MSLGGSDSRKGPCIDGLLTSPLSSKTGSGSSAQQQPSSSRKRAAHVQTSLCELSELLQQGEKQGMFKQLMPARILSTISHENLTFLRNRDLYSTDYYDFVLNVCFSVNVRRLRVCLVTFISFIYFFCLGILKKRP